MKKIIFIICLGLFVFSQSKAQVVVIVNKNVNISSGNSSLIANIYKLEKRTWDEGAKIVVIDSKSESARNKFYSFIKQNPAELKKQWMKLQLTGEGKAPESLGSDDDIVKKVGSTNGAISFIEKSKADGSVKIIATIP